MNTISTINPEYNQMKLLLITSKSLQFEHPFLINKVITEDINSKNDPFCKGEELNKQFINILKEIGYNSDNTFLNLFNDKSIL